MKYIGAITMVLVGILIIGLTATTPGFSIVGITPIMTISVSYSQTSSYPSSIAPNDPTVFPYMTYATLLVTFSTGYDFSSVLSASATGTVTIIDYNTSSAVVSNYVTTWSVQVQKKITGIQSTTQTDYPNLNYQIVATSTYKFNNPVQGSQHVYQIFWTSNLTFDAVIVGTNSTTNKTISATGTAVYGTFPVANAYPGYIVVYNCTSSWIHLGDPYGPYTSLSFNTSQINIQIPESQSYAYLDFIYVEYNRFGNTLRGFVEAYLEFQQTAGSKWWIFSDVNAMTGNKQWIFSNTNITTYNGYPALYLHVKLSPGKYLINGYALYNFSQYNKVENVLLMSVPWNITSPSMFLPNLSIEQVISYLIGTILIIIGAIDAWRWHI
jgi:hypothetical protein